MNICLCDMTQELVHQYFLEFANDPDVFEDLSSFYIYQYQEEAVDKYWHRQRSLGRVHLAVMVDNAPVGEVILKNVDHAQKICTLSIHMKNDSVKNRGYGTQAEILALRYAFDELDMATVFADALIKNRRSRHVLEKVGFVQICRDDTFCYYRCDKNSWKCLETEQRRMSHTG